MLQDGLKEMDESRQGETLMHGVSTIEGKRKMMIESYGCQMNFWPVLCLKLDL
jgi:hypothetical protein